MIGGVDCIMIIAFLESAIQSGLSRLYKLLRTVPKFNVSAPIVDTDYQHVWFRNRTALNEDVMRSAKRTGDLRDTNCTAAITGGHSWQDQ